jgi:hypothetical protein
MGYFALIPGQLGDHYPAHGSDYRKAAVFPPGISLAGR